ncbi:hypothetical protein GY50_1341 [Dehalococcoides mccartyi GY50]|nr:hypothetical protein GY50_1341 [Dehalococcoides mccartyi GY50]
MSLVSNELINKKARGIVCLYHYIYGAPKISNIFRFEHKVLCIRKIRAKMTK